MTRSLYFLVAAGFAMVMGCGLADVGPDEESIRDVAVNDENDSPCSSPRQWRCVYSKRWQTYVSQVCRSCEDVSLDQAMSWGVCQSDDGGSSRWINFNLNPMSCDSCSGSYTVSCSANPYKTSCNMATCPNGCCTADGVCRPGTSVGGCGSHGAACMACPAGDMCLNAACVASPAAGSYSLNVYSVQTDPGVAWDPVDAAPEIFVTVTTADGVTGRTSVAPEGYSATFNETLQTAKTSALQANVRIEIHDMDAGFDDLIASCDINFSAAELKNGSATRTCEDGNHIAFRFTAR